MNYDRLTAGQWSAQVTRIEESRGAISARDQVAAAGRVIPGESDLVFGTGRHLKAAVLYLDISGFSSRPAETQQEQEVLLRVLTFFFTEMVRIAEEYGGTVEKNTGDGLMAYFEDGGGNPSEVGTKRAVSAALSMFYTTDAALNPVISRSSALPIRFRVGIEYGWITIAKLGAARRFGSLAAIGTTANMASKMLDKADPGELIIGEAAKLQLPILWQLDWCKQLPNPSGWEYRASKAPYPFYRYVGRWTTPRP